MRAVPDLAGIVLKADSEGRVGPSAYKRTHADAANVIARALKPHGGVFCYRGFVYDHRMDWRNLKNDRARAAYDNFISLDGQFDDNVIIQIKHGPIDFQVREPASPLFGALKKTNEAIELQITQEYFGQGRHTVFLVPMWKETLDFDMQVKRAAARRSSRSCRARRGATRPAGSSACRTSAAMPNWFGNHMSQANLYGFGRLAWNPDLTSKEIIDEWTRLTFGSDPRSSRPSTTSSSILAGVRELHRPARPADPHRHRRQPLQRVGRGVGAQRLGPVAPRRREGRRHGSHRRDRHGLQRPVLAGGRRDLRVARHHAGRSGAVPSSPAVHAQAASGKTVIQFIYDSHYEGADAVAGWVRDWKALEGKVDAERYAAILKQLEYQAGQAIVWRDAVARWFHRTSGIPDSRRTRRHLSGPHRGRGGDPRRLRAAR